MPGFDSPTQGFASEQDMRGRQFNGAGQTNGAKVHSGALERLHAIGRSVQSLNLDLSIFINVLEHGNVPQEKLGDANLPDVPHSLHGALDFIQDQLMAMEKLHSTIRSKF